MEVLQLLPRHRAAPPWTQSLGLLDGVVRLSGGKWRSLARHSLQRSRTPTVAAYLVRRSNHFVNCASQSSGRTSSAFRCPRSYCLSSARLASSAKSRILRLLDRDPDALDRSAMELSRRLVLLADGVAAVVADAEPVARQRELARLRLHRAFGDDLVVDVETGLPERLVVRAGPLADELHAERVLAGLQDFRRDELLLRLDAEEVVDVVELVVLDEQRVTAEARAVGEDARRAAFASVISTLARILYERLRTLTATPSGTGAVPG